jgi:predicted membrane protein
MIYYACATDYPLVVFAGATMLSYATLGMVKQVAWIVALRTIATRLKGEGFGVLGDVTRDMSPMTKCATLALLHKLCLLLTGPLFNLGRNILGTVGAVGAIVIAWKVVMAAQRCCRSEPANGEAHVSDLSFTQADSPDKQAPVHNPARNRLPTLPQTSGSGDKRVNAGVRAAFDR